MKTWEREKEWINDIYDGYCGVGLIIKLKKKNKSGLKNFIMGSNQTFI